MELKFDYEKTDSEKKKIKREIIIWASCILGAILSAFLITRFGMVKINVTDSSMSETLDKNNKILVNKFVYTFTSPKRFDIIVFELKGREHVFYNIKRVVGLPGEKVQIKDGSVYINGKKQSDIVNVSQIINPGLASEEIELGKDEYFVLGDNRNNSEDSRYANIGSIHKDDIVGKAWIKLSPFDFVSKINLIEHEEEQK